jgi:hypothetical protein
MMVTPPEPASEPPAEASLDCGGAAHLPSTVSFSLHCGSVACCSRVNSMLDDTPTSGTPGTGTTHEKRSLGPEYWIWTTAVVRPSPRLMKMMRSPSCTTGCCCEQKKPPQAAAGRGAVSPVVNRAASSAASSREAPSVIIPPQVEPRDVRWLARLYGGAAVVGETNRSPPTNL